MRALFTLLLVCVVATGCRKEVDAPLPLATWDLFESVNAVWLPTGPQQSMQGVYQVVQGNDVLGDQVALKWTWTAQDNDTAYYVSMFTGFNAGYFIGQGKVLNGDILLNGYWRQVVNTNTGLMRLTITGNEGASLLLGPSPVLTSGSVVVRGSLGDGQEVPQRPVELRWVRPLYNGPFERMAHRAGGRTSDMLSVSENSVEMIRKASRFGATGVEIDVRFTSDGVPILYHDNTLNLRLIQPCGLVGPIEDYTYAQLNGLVRLINGEKIPTLSEALHTVVYETPLHVVWMDTKYVGSLAPVRALQEQYLQEAQALGREVRILVGLPGEDQVNMLKELPDYQNIPSLCELSIDDVRAVNAQVWGPRWTQGTQIDEVTTMQSEGRDVFVWTVDVDEYIQQFTQQSTMNGVLSNYPSLVAYYHYVR